MSKRKYCVVGAGAIGSVLGSFPAKGGQEVWFLDPFKAHMDAIAENGLVMHSRSYSNPNDVTTTTVRVNATTNADDVGKVDVAILMVKGIFTESAIPNLKKICDENTIILSCQNGMGNLDILKEHFPEENIAYGVTLINSALEAPGVVRPNIPDQDKHAHIGSDNKALKPRLEEIVADFRAGGCDMDYDDDIKDKVWAKLVVNCTNALYALLCMTARRVITYEDGAYLVTKLREECIAIGEAHGAKFTPGLATIPCIPWDISPVADAFPSTSQDLRAKKKTENWFLSGYMVREGQKLGIPTPYSDMLYRMVSVMEQGYEYMQ